MKAEVCELPGIDWSAEAALGHAMNRIQPGEHLVVAWINPDGSFHFSQAGLTRIQLCWIGSLLHTESMHTNQGNLHDGAIDPFPTPPLPSSV